jgi:hypothetical protein
MIYFSVIWHMHLLLLIHIPRRRLIILRQRRPAISKFNCIVSAKVNLFLLCVPYLHSPVLSFSICCLTLVYNYMITFFMSKRSPLSLVSGSKLKMSAQVSVAAVAQKITYVVRIQQEYLYVGLCSLLSSSTWWGNRDRIMKWGMSSSFHLFPYSH